jgi:hypothetical protein
LLEKFIENFLMRSRTAQQQNTEHLLAGRCKDYAEYKHSIGKLKGFIEADDLVRSLYKDMINHVEIKHYREISRAKEPESY